MADIGELVFRNLLNIRTYPSTPFTGNLGTDLTVYFIIPLITFLISNIYWPLLYIRLRDQLSNSYDLTKNRLGLSFVFSFIVFLIALFSGYFSSYAQLIGAYFLIALPLSLVPVTLLLVYSKVASRNVKLMLIILSVLSHVLLNPSILIIEIIFIIIITAIITKFQGKAKAS